MSRRIIQVLGALALIATATVAGGPSAGAATPTHGDAVDLGTLAGPISDTFYSSAEAVNEAGAVVGWSLNAADQPHAFYRSPTGAYTDLGTLGGRLSEATGVNNLGQVVGRSHRSFVNFASRGFIWSPSTGMRGIGTFGGPESWAADINDAGQVVGWAETSNDEVRAFVAQNGRNLRDLGTLGGSSATASAINQRGQIAGGAQTSSGAAHAAVWDPVAGTLDLGTLGGAWSYANDINEVGQVAGVSLTTTGDRHAFFWDPTGGMIDLGTLGGAISEAFGLNADGQVVGTSRTAGDDERAFVWDATHGMVDLGTLGGPWSSGADINDRGQAVGAAYTPHPGEIYHAAMWPPVISVVTPPQGATYDLHEPVAADYTCIGGCVGDVDPGELIDTSTPGPHTFTVTNGSTSIVRKYTVRPDTTPPVITLDTPADGGVYALGESVPAQYACDDGPNSSGLTTCVGDAPTGGPIDTSSVGSHDFTVQAADAAGNTATASRTYHVVPATVSIGDASVAEGDAGKPRAMRFAVTLSLPSTQPVTVDWSIDGTGSASPDDYAVKSGTVTFTPSPRTGLTPTTKYVTVKVTPDQAIEPNEDLAVVLTNPTGGYALGRGQGTGTILDDDPPAGVTVSVGDAAVVEGAAGTARVVKVSLTLSAPSNVPVSVVLAVSDGSASGASDYRPIPTRTITFAPGQWQKTVSVKVLSDTVAEADETILLVLSSPTGATLGRAAGTITILDDD